MILDSLSQKSASLCQELAAVAEPAVRAKLRVVLAGRPVSVGWGCRPWDRFLARLTEIATVAAKVGVQLASISAHCPRLRGWLNHSWRAQRVTTIWVMEGEEFGGAESIRR